MKKGGKNTSTAFKNVFRSYMTTGIKLEKWQWAGTMMLLVVVAGFIGWVYEFIFYFFDGGMKDFYMQGGNFLPWINIYAIGTILIVLSCWKIRKFPWAVFFLSMIVTGLLEFVGGWLVYTIGNGTRYWDYNIEIWNFGNIGGFVCLRSVLIFGLSALALMYLILPWLMFLAQKLPKRAFLALTISLFTVVIADEIYNLLASKLFGWPDAMEFYRSIGWKYRT